MLCPAPHQYSIQKLTGLITQNEFSFCKEEKRRRSGLRQVFLMSQMEIQASYVVQLFAVWCTSFATCSWTPFSHVTYYSMNHSEIATNIKNLSTFLILQNAISCKTKRQLRINNCLRHTVFNTQSAVSLLLTPSWARWVTAATTSAFHCKRRPGICRAI